VKINAGMQRFLNPLDKRGQVAVIVMVAVLFMVAIAIVPIISSLNNESAMSKLTGDGYVVLASGEYATLIDKLNAIGTKADAAVIAAQNAVVSAQAAVVAAETAATKVDLFNSAEVFLFPSITNATVTLVAGDTNAWGSWTEIVDSNAVTLSSKFASSPGYISDMYIYGHSAVDKLYCLEIAYGASKITLGRVMYHTSFIEMAPIKSRLVPEGETVYYRMMCSGANGATAKVGFRYFYE
jgi:hypothetical protein